MNKSSLPSSTDTAKASLKVLKRPSAPNAQIQSRDSTLIDLLMFGQDNDIPRRLNRKSTGKPSQCARHPTEEAEYFERYSPPVAVSSTLRSIKSAKDLSSVREIGINANSKMRLQQKYEEALEKLSELRSNYKLRKNEKHQILNHTSKGFPQY